MGNSKKYIDNKNKKLGFDIGLAWNKLRRDVLFMLVKKANMDICYRCGNIIDDVKHLSIEHKNAYSLSDNPEREFFDIENIAFSHSNCNTMARVAEKPINHGTDWAYNKGCRCELCVKKRSEYRKELKNRKKILS